MSIRIRSLVRQGSNDGSFVSNQSLHLQPENRQRLQISVLAFYGQVESFEANPRIARVLAKNTRLNHCGNIRVHACALGERSGHENLYLYQRDGQDSFLPEHNNFSSTGETIRVPVVSLDSHNLRPTVIKIDTEGYELQVVRGSA
jgi:FkbM family methyltransferase